MPVSSKSLIFGVIFSAALAAHARLLHLPYFWDEAGYYIPTARDFLFSGALIPTSTLTNAHPPLPSLYLALWWKLLGYSPVVTRVAMLAVASFALLQIFLLAKRVSNLNVAVTATLLSSIYPVFFAQSSLAHADLPAMALTLWALRLYIEGSRVGCAITFCIAVLAKETAIVTPLALFAWEALTVAMVATGWDLHFSPPNHRGTVERIDIRQNISRLSEPLLLLLPIVPLALWFAYHRMQTGHVFGNPKFFQYNVTATLAPMRMLLALFQRLWQISGYMGLWTLTTITCAAMMLPPLSDNGTKRKRIELATQTWFGLVILAHVMLFSIIGGAVLARYMMPVIPLVIIICASTLWRRVREWPWLAGLVGVVFVVGWFINPPFRFSPEDNLNYADYVRIHQDAARYVEQHYTHLRVLTAWTATDELSKPYLGYVERPVAVMAIENFSFEQMLMAQQSGAYGVAVLFSTKYEPPRRLFRWGWWEKQTVRYFDYHRDVSAELGARMLGGTIVMKEKQNGQWIAVIEITRSNNAMLRQASGGGFHFDSPSLSSR